MTFQFFSNFWPFFSTRAFLSSSDDPPFKELTDHDLRRVNGLFVSCGSGNQNFKASCRLIICKPVSMQVRDLSFIIGGGGWVEIFKNWNFFLDPLPFC